MAPRTHAPSKAAAGPRPAGGYNGTRAAAGPPDRPETVAGFCRELFESGALRGAGAAAQAAVETACGRVVLHL
ncbi:MAG: hypothetical protein KDD51_01735, partial [Bdellovibrionales bacterium]|nr:hypothetical protein [Bdellovibrionales bacterium]